MEVRIKYTKQMIEAARLSALIAMQDKADIVEKYLREDNEESIELDLNNFDEGQKIQLAALFGGLIVLQKEDEANNKSVLRRMFKK